MSDNAVIEIFVKTQDGKSKVGATFLDNDPNFRYANKIFPEAMMDFLNESGDPVKVTVYDLNIISKRINIFKSQFININRSILAKLDSILNFVKNNQSIYEGIKVYI